MVGGWQGSIGSDGTSTDSPARCVLMGALLAVLVHDGVDALAHILVVDVDSSLLDHHAAFLFVEVVVALVLAPSTGFPRGRYIARNDLQMALDVTRGFIFLIGQVALQTGLHGSLCGTNAADLTVSTGEWYGMDVLPSVASSQQAYQHSHNNRHTHREGKSKNHSVRVGRCRCLSSSNRWPLSVDLAIPSDEVVNGYETATDRRTTLVPQTDTEHSAGARSPQWGLCDGGAWRASVSVRFEFRSAALDDEHRQLGSVWLASHLMRPS